MATKSKKADHEYLDATGAVVETEEEATGVRYTPVNSTESIDWQSGLTAGTPAAMVWAFGAKTLNGNVTSASRQAGRKSIAEQLDDLRARQALIDSGVWIDRTREAFKPDLEKLVEAFIENAVTQGKITQEQADTEKRAVYTKRANDEKDDWAKNAYGIPAVKEIYARLIGKPIKTVDDLL